MWVEKSHAEFPPNGVSCCRPCYWERRKKQKDPEIAEFEKEMRTPNKITNKIKAIEVIDGLAFQFRLYLPKLTEALEKVTNPDERKEIIAEFMIQYEVITKI